MYKGVVCSSMEQKEGKHTFIILAKAQHERHHFQLRSTRCTLRKKFWPCPIPYIFEQKTITQLWGQQRTQKGEQGI